eukprot:6685997-Pyramimonas_sp.AAC.1
MAKGCECTLKRIAPRPAKMMMMAMLMQMPMVMRMGDRDKENVNDTADDDDDDDEFRQSKLPTPKLRLLCSGKRKRNIDVLFTRATSGFLPARFQIKLPNQRREERGKLGKRR